MVVLKGTDLFQRQHHNDILSALRSLDGELLLDAECYFAGDTAIVLNLDEYRESVDIDFLCASQEGYRKLRQALWGRHDLASLLLPGAHLKTLLNIFPALKDGDFPSFRGDIEPLRDESS